MLYNYFSQVKRLPFLLLVFAISLFGFLLTSSLEIFSDQNLYYYTFSTIVQGFLTLVALLGAVVIYKLQIIETELNQTKDTLIPLVMYYRGLPTKTYSWTGMMNETRKILDDKKQVNRAEIEVGWKRLDALSKERNEIRTQMVEFALISFINISLALIGLPISKSLVIHNIFTGVAVLLFLSILFSIFSLFFAFRIIRKILGYSFVKKLNN